MLVQRDNGPSLFDRLRRIASGACASAILLVAVGGGTPARRAADAASGVVVDAGVPKPSHARVVAAAAPAAPAKAKPKAAKAPAVSKPKPPAAATPVAGLFYASSSFWNTKIPSAPALAPNSDAIVQASLVAYKSNANFANTDAWGIAIVRATSGDKKFSIGCDYFDCDTPVSFRIPAGAKPTTGSDHHLVVIDGTKELDMWRASYDASSETWSAGSRYVTNVYGWGAICGLGQHCNGAVASGFAAFGGIPRPEEFGGSVIPHALTITSPFTRADFIACPATHSDGEEASSSAIPEGARIQLDPSFSVAAQSWPHWKKVIAKTLQVYGAYVSDTGGTLAIRGEADINRPGAWADAGVPEGASLADLPWAKMRVLKLQEC